MIHLRESVPHLSTHAAHIALLLWNRAREPRYNVKITASLIVGMFEEQHINRPEHISHFISTAVPVVVGQQDPLEIFFNSMMAKEKDMLEPKNLYNNVFLSTVILQGCPRKVDLKKEEDRRKVLFTLARAFHRYQCGGSVIGDRRIGWRIPTVFLNSLKYVVSLFLSILPCNICDDFPRLVSYSNATGKASWTISSTILSISGSCPY